MVLSLRTLIELLMFDAAGGLNLLSLFAATLMTKL